MYLDNGGLVEGEVFLGYDWLIFNSIKCYNQMCDVFLNQDCIIEYFFCIWGYVNVVEWGNDIGYSW